MSSPAYYAIIPANVRYSKKIEPNAKLLYGEITSLCHQEGFCWAKNEYFAQLYDVDERTIKRWLVSLKKEKFISISNEKKGFKNDRKIWISQEIKKMFTKGQKCPSEGDKNVPSINNKYEYKEKNIKKRKDKDSSPKITYNKETRKFEGITQADLKAWRDTYPSVNVQKVIDECAIWAFSNEREHYRISINTFMANKEKNHTTPYKEQEKSNTEVSESEVNENRKLSEEWERKFEGKGNGMYSINASPSKILFMMPNGQNFDVSYDLKTEEFKKKCQPALIRMKLN